MKKLNHNLIVIFLSRSLHITSLQAYIIFMPLLLLENRCNIVVICNWQFFWLSTIWKWFPYPFIFLYVNVVKVGGIENQTKFTSRLESWWLWMTSVTHITISSTLLRLVCSKFHNSTTWCGLMPIHIQIWFPSLDLCLLILVFLGVTIPHYILLMSDLLKLNSQRQNY